jgi:hypothetical protein
LRERFDAGFQFDERAEVGWPRHAACVHLPGLVWVSTVCHGSGGECFRPNAIFCVSSSTLRTLTVTSVARLEQRRWIRDPRPAHLGHVQQSLDAAAKIDERAEVAHRRHAARQHGTSDNGLPDLVGDGALFLLEHRPPRDDDVPSAFLVIGDAERVDAADVLGRICVSNGIDLRERAEGALAANTDLVTAFHVPLDLAFHRQACAVRLSRCLSVAARVRACRDSVRPPSVDTTTA